MPVSGSNDFGLTAIQIITRALILCGGLEDDETPTDEQYNYALQTLNMMAKAWSTKGLKAWCWREESLTLVVGDADYTIGPSLSSDLVTERPLEVRNVRKVVSGNDETPVRIFSRSEYMDQPSKDSQGEPVAVYYDPQLNDGVLYVWPSPSGTDTLKFSSKQYIEDFDVQNNDPYFPAEWLLAIEYNLAFLLCPKYEVTGEDRIMLMTMAEKFLMEAENNDVEQGSLYIAPEAVYADY